MQAFWLPSPALTNAVDTVVGLSPQTPFLTLGRLHCPGNLGAAGTWLATRQAGLPGHSWQAWQKCGPALLRSRQFPLQPFHSYLDFHAEKWWVWQRKTNFIRYHLCMESKIWYKWTYLQNRNRLTGIENKLTATKGDGGKWGGGG